MLSCEFLPSFKYPPNNTRLGAIEFSTCGVKAFSPQRSVTALAPINGSLSIEQWSATPKVIRECAGNTHVARNEHYQLLSTRIDEQDYADLATATEQAYNDILQHVKN